jgi:UDP-2,3-diacylglucosamine pyrophosphatase LpxH
LAVCAGAVDGGVATARQPSDRLLVVISDLHFGVGRDGQAWHPMEDFRWASEFQAFLDEVHVQGKGKTDLVIAGDAFELWQSRTADCMPPDRDAGCSEAEALARLKIVVAGHDTELRALGRFATAADNRLVFVPGNHDAALLFPTVAQAAIDATGAGPGRVRVEAGGYWMSPDKLLLVEHGHQMGKEVNKLRLWPRPFIGVNPARLERSWGEQFVQKFYNQYEAKYPVIDNVSEEGVGIGYAREVEGWLGTATAVGRFIQFYSTSLSLHQHAGVLGSGANPPWDIEAVKSRRGAFLAESLPSDDPVGRALRARPTDLDNEIEQFSNDELQMLCDARAQIEAYQREHNMAPTITRCPEKGGALGAVGQALLHRSRDAIVSEYLKQRATELKSPPLLPKVFIYGHTHLADGGFQPLAGSNPDWNPVVLNTGAWQRTVTPEQLKMLMCRVPTNRSVIELTPEELPTCYSAVVVPPTAGTPKPELRFWTTDDGQHWRFDTSCHWKASC